MGNTLSSWLGGGDPEEFGPKYDLEDDTLAGIQGSTPHDAVAAGHQAWGSRFEDRDFTGIAKLYTRDCKICPASSRTAYGRQEAVVGWQSLLSTGVDRVTFSNTALEVSSTEVISETSNYYFYDINGKEPIDHGKHIMIWRKLSDKWFIHLHIFSSSKKGEKGTFDFITEMCYLWEYTFFTRDFNALANLYTDDCVVCPPAWPQVDGNIRVHRFWARFPTMGVDHVARTVNHTEEMGPGHVVAEIAYTMLDYRNGVVDMGKSICICKKTKDGRWCIHNEVFNSDASHPVLITENEQEKSNTSFGTESKA